jgi:hypothetical protein
VEGEWNSGVVWGRRNPLDIRIEIGIFEAEDEVVVLHRLTEKVGHGFFRCAAYYDLQLLSTATNVCYYHSTTFGGHPSGELFENK